MIRDVAKRVWPGCVVLLPEGCVVLLPEGWVVLLPERSVALLPEVDEPAAPLPPVAALLLPRSLMMSWAWSW